MTRGLRRSLGVLMLATLVLGTGCQMVRAGTRCAAGAEPGRDATHVLFCKNGRWTRVMTIGQAANFLLSTKAAKVESLNGPIDMTVNSLAPVQMKAKVTSYTGTPLANVQVTFAMGIARNGASARFVTTDKATTDANGVASVLVYSGTIVGSFTATAWVVGVPEPARYSLSNRPGAPDELGIVSGDYQTIAMGATSDWMVARLIDQYGNVIGGATIETDYDPTVIAVVGEDTLTTDGDGFVRFRVQAGAILGPDYIDIGVRLPNGQYLVNTFDFQVV